MYLLYKICREDEGGLPIMEAAAPKPEDNAVPPSK
jgi:hypothetical protein